MNEEPKELAQAIVDIILRSESYSKYKSALTRIKKAPDGLARLKEIISLQEELGQKRLRGEDDFYLERHVSQNYYKALLNADMRDFFVYRKELIETYVSVFDAITNEDLVETLAI